MNLSCRKSFHFKHSNKVEIILTRRKNYDCELYTSKIPLSLQCLYINKGCLFPFLSEQIKDLHRIFHAKIRQSKGLVFLCFLLTPGHIQIDIITMEPNKNRLSPWVNGVFRTSDASKGPHLGSHWQQIVTVAGFEPASVCMIVAIPCFILQLHGKIN